MATFNTYIGPRSADWQPVVGTPTARAVAFWRECDLRDAAREDVAQRGTLARVLRGIGTEGADLADVAIVSRIVGYDVRKRATGTYGRVNVALLRSSLRRWATVEAHDLSGGAA